MAIVVIGSVFVDIKGFPDDVYSPTGRTAGRVETVHGGVGRNVAEDIANVELRPRFVSVVNDDASGEEVLRTFAIARLALDNIPHIKAYWPMLGKELALEAMAWGADDMDGTINDSTKIYSLAGAADQNPTLTVSELKRLAQDAGWNAVERDSFYKIFS